MTLHSNPSKRPDDFIDNCCGDPDCPNDCERDYSAADASRVRELESALERARYERDQVYAVNAATNYARANAFEDALQEIVALCEPDRIPLPKLNSKILRVARAALAAGGRSPVGADGEQEA